MDEPYEWIDPDDGSHHVALGATAGGKELLRVTAENSLLRRERALLIALDRARALAPWDGMGAAAGIQQSLADLHREARGGTAVPDGEQCQCLLCNHTGAPGKNSDTEDARRPSSE